MRIAVIGGSGHIGTYLMPRLVRAGHDAILVSRGIRQPYEPDPAWNSVRGVVADREAEEASGEFGPRMRALDAEAIIDLTCFTPASARHLVEALRGTGTRLLHCGTIWVHGPAVERPTTEEEPRRPFGEYGCRKAEIETFLLQEALNGFPVTILHPGHLVGRGWKVINPVANFDPRVFALLMRGEELAIPNIGNETVHHVHADDVAQAFMCAVERWDGAVGQSFHVVSPAAVTLRGYAETVAGWFGREAKLRFLPWEEWRGNWPERDAQITWDHIARSPNCSIEKARRMIGYEPRYRSLDAVREAVDSLIANGTIATH